MQILYTNEEGGTLCPFILPFGRLRLLWYLRKAKLDNGELIYDEFFGDVGFPVKFHSLKLLNGKRWDTINGWNQGIRHSYLVWKVKRYAKIWQKLVQHVLGAKSYNSYPASTLCNPERERGLNRHYSRVAVQAGRIIKPNIEYTNRKKVSKQFLAFVKQDIVW